MDIPISHKPFEVLPKLSKVDPVDLQSILRADLCISASSLNIVEIPVTTPIFLRSFNSLDISSMQSMLSKVIGSDKSKMAAAKSAQSGVHCILTCRLFFNFQWLFLNLQSCSTRWTYRLIHVVIAVGSSRK